jgi:phenylacetate 2-hydroxylase
MCTAVNFSNGVLYAAFARLILSFKITETKTAPPNVHYINYKRDPIASNAIASDFKVKFTPRSQDVVERCLGESQESLAEFMTKDSSEVLLR